VLPPQPAGRSEREAAESFLYIGVRSYRGPFPPSGRQRVESSIYGLRSLPASTRGSRGGPVSGREVTQNDGVARERKRPAQSPSRAITAGHGTLRTNLAKVGVAGSSPVVRSRECTLQPAAMQAPPRSGTSLWTDPPTKDQRMSDGVASGAGPRAERLEVRARGEGPD
jgi:hypothetical protein